jgi:hypothetical protein
MITYLKSLCIFIINLYIDHRDSIDLLKDFTLFTSAYQFIKYICNKNYIQKKKNIDDDIKLRNKLESILSDYIREKNSNTIKDISIRFICWRNYPNQLDDDGFKHTLYIEYHNNVLIENSWFNRRGIYFQEDVWLTDSSIYIDKNGIHFFGKAGKVYTGFDEYNNIRLIYHLPFENIINFDFRNSIEYEPIFYIKYPYDLFKKLYSSTYCIREKSGEKYLNIELARNMALKKFSPMRYQCKKIIICLKRLLSRCSKKKGAD